MLFLYPLSCGNGGRVVCNGTLAALMAKQRGSGKTVLRRNNTWGTYCGDIYGSEDMGGTYMMGCVYGYLQEPRELASKCIIQ